MPTPGAAPSRPTFVGRASELTRLQALADATVEHGSQMVLVSGDAGIGKSTLTSTFLRALDDAGWGTHIGNCVEYADRSLPFGPIVHILRSVLLDNLDRSDDLVGNYRDDLAGLLPELADRSGSGRSGGGDVDRLFDGISRTLTRASEIRPIALLVEDIHWADAATRDLLASLVHTVAGDRIFLIVTERSGAVSRAHPLRTWLAEQRRFPHVHTIEVDGLDRAALAMQAEEVLGEVPEPTLVDDLVERTGGNPYFSHELLVNRRDGGIELPTTLVEFLTSRLERLDDDEREVLRAVAVAGGNVQHRMLVAMLPELDLGPIVRSLYDASILSVEGNDYAFGHALLREAILRDVLPFEAEELHRRAAEAILSDPRRGRSPSDLVSLAIHWARANDANQSLRASTQAAAGSAGVAAYETAAEMSLQALYEWPLADEPENVTGLTRDQLVLQAAEWLASCYRSPEAVGLIEDALNSWARDIAPGRRALLQARMTPILYHMGEPARAGRLLVEAEQMVGDESSAEAAQVHHRVSKQALADGQINPALDAAERAIQISSVTGPPVVRIEALTTKALAIGVTQDLSDGVRLASEARALAEAEGFVSQVANTYRTEMLMRVFREGRTDASLEASRQGLAYAERYCGPRWQAEFQLDLFLGLVEAGLVLEAGPMFDQLIDAELDDLRRLTVLQTAGLRDLARGDLDGAGAFLADATEIAARYQSAQETGYQNRLLAELARRQGRLREAVELIHQAIELQLASDNITYTRDSLVENIRIVRAFMDMRHPEAHDLLSNAQRLVDDFDGAGVANVAWRALMDLELAATRKALDTDAASDAIALIEASGFHYEAAQGRLLLIEELFRDAGNRAKLTDELRAVYEIASRYGLDWVAERAVALARAARIQLDTVEPDPATTPEERPNTEGSRYQLTEREIEVLSLVAEGLTNKAIGERLYVSPRTVGTHVSNLLGKLGLSNRGEAAAAYHRLGLDEIIDLRDPIDLDAAR